MSKSFEDAPAPPYGENLVAEIRKRCPHVFLVCFRNKNRNVVVYETRVKDGKLLNPPIDAYWLVLEPSYQEPRRRKRIQHDREEFGFLDHKFAWGFDQKRVSDTEATFSFKAFPHATTIKVLGAESRLFSAKDGHKYMMQQMYVKASENLHMLRLSDNIHSIVLKGLDITTQPYKPVEVYLKGGP